MPTMQHLDNRQAGVIATADVIGVIDEIATFPQAMTAASAEDQAHPTPDETIEIEIERTIDLHVILVVVGVGVGAHVDGVVVARLPERWLHKRSLHERSN